MPLISAQRWNRIGDWVWSALLPMLYFIIRLFPARRASDLGERLGLRFGRARSPLSTLAALDNLRRIRPDYSEAQREEAVRKMWGQIGRVQSETVVIDRIWDSGAVTVRDGDIIGRALRSKRPAIFVFPHLGNWELLAILAQRQGAVVPSVYEILPDRREFELVQRSRRRIGHKVIAPDRAGLISLVGALKRGEAVGLGIDEYKRGNVIAPSFGRPPRKDTNARLVERLARKFDALVVPTYCLRTAPFEFLLSVLEPLERPSAAQLDALCESWIRAHPEQWYMLPRLRFE